MRCRRPQGVARLRVLKERLSPGVDRGVTVILKQPPWQHFTFVWCFIVFKGLSHLLAHELGED